MKSIILWLLFQTPTGSEEAASLYSAIFRESNPAAQLKLVLQFEKKFPAPVKVGLPTRKMLGEIFSIGTDCYQSLKNGPKVLEYGEKTLKLVPDDMHALVLVARQHAISGANLDRASQYAQRALKLTRDLKDKPPGAYTPQGWATFLKETATSAQSTLDYIKRVTSSLYTTRPKRM